MTASNHVKPVGLLIYQTNKFSSAAQAEGFMTEKSMPTNTSDSV